jgi:hypothetical protein
MNEFFKDIISEAFASKKQQRYFYAKAGDKSIPKKERSKWGKWSKEYSDKTNFKKLPEVAETEEELEEIVDELGNISRSKLPTDAATKGVTSKSTTDQAVKTGFNQMGAYGTQGTQGYTRYWGESDMSKTLGFDATMKQDASREDAANYFKNDLEMTDSEAEERLADMGYDPELPDDKVRLVENPRKFIEEYIESLISKRTNDSDILNKETDLSEINPIILKQIRSLKNSIDSNQISMNDLIKLLRNNE